jgi:bifunctional enzyme CysN/CysC
MNEIGRVELRVSRPLLFDPYVKTRGTGAIIVIDRITHGTVGAGMIESTSEGHWDDKAPSGLTAAPSAVTPEEREARFGQHPTTVLICGLAGSGKTEIARLVERRLFDRGRVCVALDGQGMRLGMNRDLGFTSADRSENLRRSMEVARVLNDAGILCVASFVAPEAGARAKSRALVGRDRFFLVYLSAPLEACRASGRSSLYTSAEAGVPGLSFPFEPPEDADLVLPSHELTPAECADRIVLALEKRGRLSIEWFAFGAGV